MEMFDRSVVLLALAMFLAIGIERLLELIRAAGDYREARGGPGEIEKWKKRAEGLRDRIEVRLNNAGSGTLQLVLSIVCRNLGPASPESGGLIAVSVEQVRTMSIRLQYKLLAIALGILFAFFFKLDIFALVNEELQTQPSTAAVVLHPWLGMIVSGVAMGLGAGPVHKLITALEDARRKRI